MLPSTRGSGDCCLLKNDPVDGGPVKGKRDKGPTGGLLSLTPGSWLAYLTGESARPVVRALVVAVVADLLVDSRMSGRGELQPHLTMW